MASDEARSILPFRLSRRSAFWVLCGLALALMSVLGFDVYRDWGLEGRALWATLAENALPFLLSAGVVGAGVWLWWRERSLYLLEGAKWALVGFVGTVVLAGATLSLQLLDGRIEYPVAVAHLAALGTVVGLLVGSQVARAREARQALEEQERRLRGLADSLPGVAFQLLARPSGAHEVSFVGARADDLLGVPAETDSFLERVLDRVSPSHRSVLLQAIDEAVENEQSWRVEVPYDHPSGDRLWVLAAATPERTGETTVFNGVLLDITERKGKAQQLLEHRERLATAQAIAGLGSWEHNLKTGTLCWSDQLYEIVGWDRDADVSYETFMEAVHPADREALRREQQRALEEGTPLDIEYRIRRPDGEERIVWEQGEVEVDEAGDPTVLAGTVLDITEQKAAERELRTTTQLLEKTFESLSEAVLVVDPSTRTIVTCNAAVEEIFGYAKDELIGTNTARLHMSAQAYERFAERSERALETDGVFTGEYRMRCKDGRIIETEHVVTPLESDEWAEGVVSVVRDVTDRKRHEQLLRKKQRRYQAVFEDPNILVALVDPEGRVVNINRTAMEYVDADREALRGQRFWETPWFTGVAPIQRQMRQWVERAAKGEYVEYEIDHTPALDAPLEVSGVVRPVTDEQGRVTSLLISAREVTERKQHERALVKAKEKAEEASRLKSAMLANMSHEIRTPLTSIIGFSELLSERLSGEAAQFNERIQQSSRRLMKTLGSVLELSKLEAGILDLERTTVCLKQVAEETVGLLQPRAEKEGVTLVVHGPEAAIEGQWNESALHRITENLVENAIKFTPPGGQVDVRAWPGEAGATLEVEDTGIGISEAALPEIFKAFKQESEGLQREYEGSGLGLSIVDRLVDRMEGTIEVDSEKGGGTRFVVRLPWDRRGKAP